MSLVWSHDPVEKSATLPDQCSGAEGKPHADRQRSRSQYQLRSARQPRAMGRALARRPARARQRQVVGAARGAPATGCSFTTGAIAASPTSSSAATNRNTRCGPTISTRCFRNSTRCRSSSAAARPAVVCRAVRPEISQAVRALLLWRVTGGAFAAQRLTENYYDKYIRAARDGGMAAVCDLDHFKERIEARPSNREMLMAMDPSAFIAAMQRWRDNSQGAEIRSSARASATSIPSRCRPASSRATTRPTIMRWPRPRIG